MACSQFRGAATPRVARWRSPTSSACWMKETFPFASPRPPFGLGLIESISEDTILANQAAEGAGEQFLGVSGHVQSQRKRRLDHSLRMEGSE